MGSPSFLVAYKFSFALGYDFFFFGGLHAEPAAERNHLRNRRKVGSLKHFHVSKPVSARREKGVECIVDFSGDFHVPTVFVTNISVPLADFSPIFDETNKVICIHKHTLESFAALHQLEVLD